MRGLRQRKAPRREPRHRGAMSLAEELKLLHELHDRGALSSEEYARAKARLLSAPAPARGALLGGLNALRRSASERWIAGVCGGLARATGAEAWVWRLAFALLLFCGGAGVLIYVLLWIFVPMEQATRDVEVAR